MNAPEAPQSPVARRNLPGDALTPPARQTPTRRPAKGLSVDSSLQPDRLTTAIPAVANRRPI